MKRIILFLTLCLPLNSIAQDTLSQPNKKIKNNRLTFSVRILPFLINERSIYIDYCYKNKHSIGGSIGQIYSNPIFYVNVLSLDQGKNPGTVWKGVVSRLGYKYYFSADRKSYFELELLYKSLSYSNKQFVNIQNNKSKDYHENLFSRSENANVYGATIIYGTHLTSIDKIANVEMFGGIGYRQRERFYTTYESINYNFDGPQPLGNYTLIQKYPMFVIGLKFGINTFFD